MSTNLVTNINGIYADENGSILADFTGDPGPQGPSGAIGIINLDNYGQLTSLITDEEIVPGTLYHLTYNGVYLLATTSNDLGVTGWRKMRIVNEDYYNPTVGVLGVWSESLTVAVNDVCVWGGRVWENNTGLVGTAVDDITLSIDWSLIPVSNGVYYTTKTFGCTYDFTNDWVSKQWDDRGNVFSYDYAHAQLYGASYNLLDYSDWGNPKIFDNKVTGIINNRCNLIMFNTCHRIMNNNISGNIHYNSNKGDINHNSNGDDIRYNSNAGYITSNSNTGFITHNTNNGNIGGIGAAHSDISFNINNGNIITTTTGAISDPIVNK